MPTISTKPVKPRKPDLLTINIKPLYAWIYLLVVVLLLLATTNAALFVALRHANDRVDTLAQTVAAGQIALNSDRMNAAYQPVNVSVTDSTVYFPDLRLKIPISTAAMNFRYSVRTSPLPDRSKNPKTEVDITTLSMLQNDPGTPRRLACVPLRLAFEAQSDPYNQHETNVATVALADGRTLQAYAFSDPSCTTLYAMSGTDSTALGQLFKDAQSY